MTPTFGGFQMPRDNVQIALGRSLNARLDWFLTENGLGVNPDGLRRARLRQIIQLELQSDLQLAQQGVRRDQILNHVFADLLH